MNGEVWRDIPSYEGVYQVSNIGRIRSVDRTIYINKGDKFYEQRLSGKLLSPHTIRGYHYITLRKGKKSYSEKVHRCVCLAFLDNPNGYKDVNHKNGIRTDNRVDNLEWCTRQYNIWHSYHVTMREPSGCKKVICLENGKVYPSCMAAGRDLGLAKSGHIAYVAKGIYKQYRGYHFKFTE